MVKFSPKKKNKIIQDNDNCQCNINEEINNTTQYNCQCPCIECPDEDPELDIEVDEDPEIEVDVETEDPELYTDVIYGIPGRDGTINGFNQLTLEGGENVEVVTVGEGKVGTATIYVDMSGKVTHLTELTEEYASENLGEIVQYIGDETGDYLTGYFYQACEEIIIDENGEEVTRYYWERVSVQPETDLKPIEERVESLEEGKVDKTTEPNKIYGTDGDGKQTIYEKEDFGKVDDVRLLNIATGEYESVVEEKIAKLAPEAVDIAYTNDQYPTMQTLQDAMDKLLYIEPSVSISGGGTYEKGSSVSSVNLRWTWNKKVVSQSLNQGIGDLDPTLRTYAYTPANPITTNTTFTITGNDGTKDKSSSTTVSFSQKRYWGVSEKTSLTDAEIHALSQEFSSSRAQTRTFNCSGGKYFYFVIKSSYCNGIGFKVGGLSFSDMLVETRQFKNASGFTDSYNIYRVNNIQTGAAIVVEVL